MSLSDFSGEPDFINEEGVKWWRDDFITHYAQKPDIHGTKLNNIICWAVEFPDGQRTRLLIDNEKGIPIHESPTLEGMGIEIDLLKFMKRSKH